MAKLIDLTSKIFTRLTVLSQDANRNGRTYWNCECECGTKKSLLGKTLVNGKVKSCGCLNNEKRIARSRKHDACDTLAYNSWKGMKQRCLNPNTPQFKDYGGRGITIHEKWVKDFKSFLDYMGEPELGMSIDRIDNSKGYEPGNVRWANRKQQARNNRRNVYVILNGQKMVRKDACTKLGIDEEKVRYRMKQGCDFKTAASFYV